MVLSWGAGPGAESNRHPRRLQDRLRQQLHAGLRGPVMRRPRNLGARLAAGAAIVVVPAVVLWARQTSRAQLRVHSFGGAVAEVVFWSAPTVVVCTLLSGDGRRSSSVALALPRALPWCGPGRPGTGTRRPHGVRRYQDGSCSPSRWSCASRKPDWTAATRMVSSARPADRSA